jgi:hypothetical protein
MGHRLKAPPGQGWLATTRTHLTALALIVIATTGLAACAAVHEAVTGRHLTCFDTPDDLCIRVADLAMAQVLTDLADDPVMRDAVGAVNAAELTIVVRPTECARIGRGPVGTRFSTPLRPATTRCWRVEGERGPDDRVFGTWVYQDQEGTLGVTG